jgi:hypothetical protein
VKQVRLRKTSAARFLSHGEKKDMEVEGRLFEKRKGSSRRGKGTREGNCGEYDPSTSYTCMKMC